MKTKPALFFLLLACFTTQLFACKKVDEDVNDANVVRIAALLPLSGALQGIGDDIRNGMTLAHERNRKTKYRYKFYYADTGVEGFDPGLVIEKLIRDKKLHAVISFGTSIARPVAATVEGFNIVHYAITRDDALAEDYRRTLTYDLSAPAFADATADFLEHFGYSNVAVLRADSDEFELSAELLDEMVGDYELRIVDTQTFSTTASDFQQQIKAAMKKKPEVFLLWAYAPQIDKLARQTFEVSEGVSMTGTFDMVTDYPQIIGQQYVSERTTVQWFDNEFQKRFGKPYLAKAPNAFDVVSRLIEAFELVGIGKSNDQLLEQLADEQQYRGVIGVVDIDEYGASDYPYGWRDASEGGVKKLEVER